MQIKCEYCGSYISDSEENCPNCGAANNGIKRTVSGTPKTISELLLFVAEKKIPVDRFGFHIGEDYRGPKAFGIYRDPATGNFVVYKNKSDGTRAVRYEGKDEAYAVNEIYQKLKEQVSDYKSFAASHDRNSSAPSSGNSYASSSSGGRNKRFRPWVIFVVVMIGVLSFSYSARMAALRRMYSQYGGYSTYDEYSTYDGYSEYHYDYNGTPYMFSDGTGAWYGYDDDGNAFETTPPSELTENPDAYYAYVDEYNTYTMDSDWDSDDDYDWSSNSGWSSDDDDDWDDDWDSGWDSDWDSDWSSDWDSDW